MNRDITLNVTIRTKPTLLGWLLIKQVLFYKNHIPYKQIDIQGSHSHWHKVKVGADGEIGRISHDPENVFKPTKSQWKLINALSKWRKK